MKKILTILLAAGGLISMAGCQTGTTYQSTEQPTLMSNRSTNAPLITTDMQRFDSGIGDTATRTGGGGNGD